MGITIKDLAAWKAAGKRFVMLTAYDFPTARLLAEAEIPVLLVGDTLADNVLGYPNTIPVTMTETLARWRAGHRTNSWSAIFPSARISVPAETPSTALSST